MTRIATLSRKLSVCIAAGLITLAIVFGAIAYAGPAGPSQEALSVRSTVSSLTNETSSVTMPGPVSQTHGVFMELSSARSDPSPIAELGDAVTFAAAAR